MRLTVAHFQSFNHGDAMATLTQIFQPIRLCVCSCLPTPSSSSTARWSLSWINRLLVSMENIKRHEIQGRRTSTALQRVSWNDFLSIDFNQGVMILKIPHHSFRSYYPQFSLWQSSKMHSSPHHSVSSWDHLTSWTARHALCHRIPRASCGPATLNLCSTSPLQGSRSNSRGWK